MTAEMINLLDQHAHAKDGPQSLYEEVDRYCHKMEELLVEWNIEDPTRSETPDAVRWLVEDHIMNIYSMIIGVRRFVKPQSQKYAVDVIILRAARKIVSHIIYYAKEAARSPKEVTSDMFLYYQ